MKTVEEYLALPYTVILRRDDEGDVVARVDELPGCVAHGATPEEALEFLREVQRAWIVDALEQGDNVPEPTSEEDLPSGKWVQRVPRSLHARLVKRAKLEGVSLNHFVTWILAEAVGAEPPSRPVASQISITQGTVVVRFSQDEFFTMPNLGEPFSSSVLLGPPSAEKEN